MSSLHYPLGLVAELEIERDDRTLVDAFEAGATASRAYWGALNFKRKFIITHAALKGSEYKYLKTFYNQRGQWDTFWFRDNITRGGNALVRFSQPLYEERAQGVVTLLKKYVNLDEVAPVRALPEFDEVTAAAGTAPVLWYDANREYYLQNAGAVQLDPAAQTNDVMGTYPAKWQAGAMNFGSSIFSQFQYYHFSGAEWAKTAVNIAALAGPNQPITMFFIARHSTTSTVQVLFAVGAKSANQALGLSLDASNNYCAWCGAGDINFAANSPANTWRSLALCLEPTQAYWVNGASVSTSGAYGVNTTGPAVLGANFDGSNPANPGNAMTNADIAHVLVFAAQLTTAQVKAVHNLLGYQYGLAAV